MFSKNELKFLVGKGNFSKEYRRFLKHSINKKLEKFEKETVPILASSDYTCAWWGRLVNSGVNKALTRQRSPVQVRPGPPI